MINKSSYQTSERKEIKLVTMFAISSRNQMGILLLRFRSRKSNGGASGSRFVQWGQREACRSPIVEFLWEFRGRSDISEYNRRSAHVNSSEASPYCCFWRLDDLFYTSLPIPNRKYFICQDLYNLVKDNKYILSFYFILC